MTDRFLIYLTLDCLNLVWIIHWVSNVSHSDVARMWYSKHIRVKYTLLSGLMYLHSLLRTHTASVEAFLCLANKPLIKGNCFWQDLTRLMCGERVVSGLITRKNYLKEASSRTFLIYLHRVIFVMFIGKRLSKIAPTPISHVPHLSGLYHLRYC